MKKLRLCDRADGVRGHYCIGRPVRNCPAFTEYWNPSGWAGSGYLFTDEKLAQAVLDLLAQNKELHRELGHQDSYFDDPLRGNFKC